MALDDDMSFSDWSAHLDSLSLDSNHCWLPAYGYQPPADQASGQQQFLFLETILEETSDDLRSESSRSSHAGWPDSDSDAGSVIHVATFNGDNGSASWSGSERDLAVPSKRRRQDDGTGSGTGTGVALSRSSSLIAFESLERRLSEEEEALGGAVNAVASSTSFRTSATLRPFHPDTHRWTSSSTSSGSASSSDDEDSDDSLMQSFSSRGSFRSSGSEWLRSFRSLDSLNALQHSGSVGAGAGTGAGAVTDLSRPCQDLSQNFGDQLNQDDNTAHSGEFYDDPRTMPIRSERSHSLSPKPAIRSLLDTTFSLSDQEDLAHTRDDFLDGPDPDSSSSSSSSSKDDEVLNVTYTINETVDECISLSLSPESVAPVHNASQDGARTQRSAENLSEDSGFGEHVLHSKRLPGPVCPILEDDDSCSSYYSDCSGTGDRDRKAGEVNDEWGVGDSKLSTCWHRSAPDLRRVLGASVSASSQEHPQEHGDVVEGALCAPHLAMASTPDLATDPKPDHEREITKSTSCGAVGKGVHFCPVVSEVSWRESLSDAEDELDRAIWTSSDVQQAESVKYKLHISPPDGQGVRDFSVIEQKTVEVDRQTDQPVRPTAVPAPDTTSPSQQPQQQARAPPTVRAATATLGRPSVSSMSAPVPQSPGNGTHQVPLAGSPKKSSRFGDFFHRFSFRRLSGRVHDGKKKSPVAHAPVKQSKQQGTNTHNASPATDLEDVRIIPLHPTPEELEAERREEERRRALVSKPPLPPSAPPRGAGRHHPHRAPAPTHAPREPRDVTTAAAAAAVAASVAAAWRSSSSMAGLLETDLDADLPPRPPSAARGGPKARSLLDVSVGPRDGGRHHAPQSSDHSREASPSDSSRAKSMEFLLDKRNQEAVQVRAILVVGEYLPPENALQGRVLSEHELRVQRSLQRLNVPDWYKNSVRPVEGFLLKRGSDAGVGGRRSAGGWPGLGVKTTSLSSLGSAPTSTLRSPTSGTRLGSSPSPPPAGAAFTRWSSSRLHSAGATPSTSPCGSARSSFNYRQPYLGWRSQERLANPRTPAERLAQGLLPQAKAQQEHEHGHLQDTSRLQQNEQVNCSPNLSEVRTSIKEVTSAIVHYVSSAKGSGSDVRLSGAQGSKTASPRGSNSRLCWLESSFVGSRRAETPQTPACTEIQNSTSSTSSSAPHQDLYLDLQKRGAHHNHSHGYSSQSQGGPVSRPSPGSTTMEDVLDSLLGLPPPSRSPSPSPGPGPGPGPGPLGASATMRSCAELRLDPAESASDAQYIPAPAAPAPAPEPIRRRSEGSVPYTLEIQAPGSSQDRTARRVSFDVSGGGSDGLTSSGELLIRCRNTNCTNSATVVEARRTFKMCHNCAHAYCSKECRRAHWERHRRTCLHSRVGALCRRVVARIKEHPQQVSVTARRGYLSHGRGAVKVFFSSPELAEAFCSGAGGSVTVDPAYVRWADLLPAEMGPAFYEDLLRLCRSYNVDTRLVLYVVICVVSEVPTSGAVKWERQLVSRVSKIRLDPATAPVPTSIPAKNNNTGDSIARDSDNPETLILTSLPGPHGPKTREINFCNIQRHLKQRGVSLRKQFPDVHSRLVAYVEGRIDKFTPATVYPVDTSSGKRFMCIIMPDAEPGKLQLVPKDSSRVQTVDISVEMNPGATSSDLHTK